MTSAIELAIAGKEKKLYLENIVDALNKVQCNKALENIKNIASVYLADSKYTNIYYEIQIDKNTGFIVNNNIPRHIPRYICCIGFQYRLMLLLLLNLLALPRSKLSL